MLILAAINGRPYITAVCEIVPELLEGVSPLEHTALAYQLEGSLLKRLVGQPQTLYPLSRGVTYIVDLTCDCLKTTLGLNHPERPNT